MWLGEEKRCTDVESFRHLLADLNGLTQVQGHDSLARKLQGFEKSGMPLKDYFQKLELQKPSPLLSMTRKPICYRQTIDTTNIHSKSGTVETLVTQDKAIASLSTEDQEVAEVQRCVQEVEGAKMTVFQKQDQKAWQYFYGIIQNTYFQRAWIIQEMVLNKNRIIQIGHNTFDGSKVFDAVDTLAKNPWLQQEVQTLGPFPQKEFSRVLMLSQVAHAHAKHDFDIRMPLGHLLYDLKGKQASEPRDQIYSLIGIASYQSKIMPSSGPLGLMQVRPRLVYPSRFDKTLYQKNPKAYPPPPFIMDVQIPTYTIYRDAAEFIMKDEKSLALLGQVNSETRNHEAWASWVPDWSHAQPEPLSGRGNAFRHLEFVLPESDRTAWRGQDFLIEREELTVKAHQVGTITNTLRLSTDAAAGKQVLDLLNSCKGDKAMEQKLWQTLIYEPDGTPISTSVLSLASSTLRKHKGEINTLDVAEPLQLAHGSPSWTRNILSSRFTSRNTTPEVMKECRTLLTKASANWRDTARTLSRTGQGMLVLGPGGAKSGDGVFVVAGSPAPLLLREEDMGVSIFVGDAHVHGLAKNLKKRSKILDAKKLVIK